jgi:hypothetical protein
MKMQNPNKQAFWVKIAKSRNGLSRPAHAVGLAGCHDSACSGAGTTKTENAKQPLSSNLPVA